MGRREPVRSILFKSGHDTQVVKIRHLFIPSKKFATDLKTAFNCSNYCNSSFHHSIWLATLTIQHLGLLAIANDEILDAQNSSLTEEAESGINAIVDKGGRDPGSTRLELWGEGVQEDQSSFRIGVLADEPTVRGLNLLEAGLESIQVVPSTKANLYGSGPVALLDATKANSLASDGAFAAKAAQSEDFFAVDDVADVSAIRVGGELEAMELPRLGLAKGCSEFKASIGAILRAAGSQTLVNAIDDSIGNVEAPNEGLVSISDEEDTVGETEVVLWVR